MNVSTGHGAMARKVFELNAGLRSPLAIVSAVGFVAAGVLLLAGRIHGNHYLCMALGALVPYSVLLAAGEWTDTASFASEDFHAADNQTITRRDGRVARGGTLL